MKINMQITKVNGCPSLFNARELFVCAVGCVCVDDRLEVVTLKVPVGKAASMHKGIDGSNDGTYSNMETLCLHMLVCRFSYRDSLHTQCHMYSAVILISKGRS